MPQYNRIFLSNGRDARDPRLIEMARKMGATPVEIWEDREYWGETNAMLYLRDRFADDSFRCLLFSRIKCSIDLYAKDFFPPPVNTHVVGVRSGHRGKPKLSTIQFADPARPLNVQ